MTTIINIFTPRQIPYFSTDFDKICVKVNGMSSILLQETVITYFAFSFKTGIAFGNELMRFVGS